jgi:hypothetical protein
MSLGPHSWKIDSDFLLRWFADPAVNPVNFVSKGTRSLAILTTWKIWCERNSRIFNNKEMSVARISEDIRDTARLWGAADSGKKISRLPFFFTYYFFGLIPTALWRLVYNRRVTHRPARVS